MEESTRDLVGALDQGVRSLAEQMVMWTPRVIMAALVMVLALWAGRLLGRVISAPFARATPTFRRFVERVTGLVVAIVGAALALNIVGLGAFAAGLLASGSVVAIVLGFAFQQIGTNLIAGVFLAFDRPFKVGDIIECDGFQGVVRSVDLRSTHIRNFDGRDIFVPNATVFTTTLINFTVDDLRRRSFSVAIRYEDDAARAVDLLRDAAVGIPGVLSSPQPAVAVHELAQSAVVLQVAFWVSMDDSVERRLSVAGDVMDACRRALLEHGYTVSANVTSAVELSGPNVPEPQPVHVAMARA